jgi:hypothetical protein
MKIPEDTKTEIQYNGEYLYFAGIGHAFIHGFFEHYITKSGIDFKCFRGDKTSVWHVDNKEMTYENEEWTEIVREPFLINYDWSESFSFPTTTNVSAKTIGSELVGMAPDPNPPKENNQFKYNTKIMKKKEEYNPLDNNDNSMGNTTWNEYFIGGLVFVAFVTVVYMTRDYWSQWIGLGL